MANYGLQAIPSRVAFTGFSPTLGSGDANTPSTSGYVYANGLFDQDADLARILRNGGQSSAVNRIMYALLGAVVGGNATKTITRVKGSLGSAEAVPVIETVTLVNRNTTAADLVAVQALFNRTVFPSTYAVDVGGNGGGGKAGI